MLKFIKRWGGKIYFRGVAFLIIGKKGKTMPDTERIIQEFDQLVSRHGKLILFLCQRASYGRVGMCSELRQECYAELLLRLAERGTALEGTREKAWVYGRCRVAIDRYLRHLRHLSTLPFPEGMEEMLAAPAETPPPRHRSRWPPISPPPSARPRGVSSSCWPRAPTTRRWSARWA